MSAAQASLELGDGWILRPFRGRDVAALVEHADNHNVWITLLDRFPHPFTEADAVAWIRSVGGQDPVRNFAIAGRRGVVGSIGLHLQQDVFHRGAEIGFWLAEPYWGRGITTRAVRAIVAHGFAAFDLLRIYAHVYESNPASARVLEKAGFRHEGRLRRAVVKAGKIMDLDIYAILRDEVPREEKPGDDR